MSDYGPPPGPPPGPPGPPPGGPGAHAAPASTSASGSAQQITYLGYAAVLLGLLSFVWGFLDWFGDDSASVSGYSALGGPAGAVIGLALVAGLLAAAATFEKRELGITPAVVAVAGLLVAFGALVGHGDGGGAADAKIGLILAFITAILQAAALTVAWLMANDRMPAFGSSTPAASANPWQQQGPSGPQAPGPFGGYGDQGPSPYGPPPGYGAPPQDASTGYGPPPGPPPGYGPPLQEQAPSYGPPPQEQAPSYGPPPQEQAPSYGPPPQEQAPSYAPPSYAPPSTPSYGPPAQDAAPSYGPPAGAPSGYGIPQPSDEDDASRTQVLPRFTGDPNAGPDHGSTQHGIPIFDPQSRPDESSEPPR